MPERFFAPCPRGLEAALAQELTGLGAKGTASAEGGVGFEGELDLAYRSNLESRLASRILWRVGGGAYRNERDLYALVQALDWPRLFVPSRSLRVDIAATGSRLQSLEFATLRVKDAVCDRFRDACGVRPSVDKRAPDVRVHAHLTEREATIYVDTSGEPLFKRGYRRDADSAPLRENLAAGLLALAQWTPQRALLDPMCGSGTIVTEAAMVAADRAPGLSRTFGFQKLAFYDGPTWQRIRQSAHDRQRPAPREPTLFASDIALAAVARTQTTLRAAKVDGFVRVERADVLTRSAPTPEGLLLANPPYGVRLADADALAALYPRLGDALKHRFAGWTAALFTGDLRLARLIGLSPQRRIPLWNGAIECRLFVFRMVSGAMRR
ncbi:MAG TPA: THUMP domain-containing protein [Casimicrobiaceae bacterium]|jgi:putative N6-adenine-specific DNA methylase|nr:THUMP domain-containing protein [Casimicrobiaceae bacterium]